MTTANHYPEARRARPRNYLTGVLCAIGTAFFLSGNNVALVVYYDGGGTIPAMMFLRYLCYVVAVGFACQATGVSLRLVEGEQSRTALIGTVYAAGMISLLTSFTMIPVSLAILVLYTFPLITTLITAALERRFPGFVLLGCLALALAGLAVALEVHDFDHDPIGIVAASCASLCFATTFVLSDRWLQHLEPMAVSYHISVPGLVIMFFVYAGYLLTQNVGSPDAMEFGLPDRGSPGSYGLVVSIVYYMIAILMMFRAIQEIGSPSTAMIMNLEPVFTIAMVTVFLSTAFTLPHVAGAAVVIAAVLLSQWAATPVRNAASSNVR